LGQARFLLNVSGIDGGVGDWLFVQIQQARVFRRQHSTSPGRGGLRAKILTHKKLRVTA
jgi:hypothetical protein